MSEKLQQFESLTEVGVGAVPAGVTGLALGAERGTDIIHRTKITLSNLNVPMTDGGVNGSIGSQEVYDFPLGNIQIISATVKLTAIARVGTAIGATATVKHSLGTSAEATDDTLDSVQANIVPSTNAVLVAGAGAAVGVSTASLAADGHSAAKKAFLNFGVADAGSSGNDALTVTGEIHLVWVNSRGD